ncbi:MAG: hypothetical protein SFU55_07225 [Methylophilus sp.]|nr:hypothetical protein [Methylophilus sp.]
MKLTKIALACTLAVSAMTAQAAAVPVPGTATTIYFSGASAPDQFLTAVAGTMFQAGFITVTSADGNYRAYVGKSAGFTGVPAGTDLVFMKRSQGGSVWGVDPVARAQQIKYLNLADATCTNSNATTYVCPVAGTDPSTSVAGVGLIPDFGVSDVEPAMFKGEYNVENGLTQLTNAEAGRLKAFGVNQLMMGIVATNSVADTTHLSRANYAGMLAGKITDWSPVDGSADPVVVCRRVNGSGTQASYNWFFTGFPCNAASSGFADLAPALASNSFGYTATTGTAADPHIIDPTAGFTVVENSGSGDVRNCLSRAHFGLDHTVQGDTGVFYKVLFSTVPGTPAGTPTVTGTGTNPLPVQGGPSKAIGVLSLDSYVRANTNYAQTVGTGAAANTFTYPGSGWSFRMLDGAGVFNGATQTCTGTCTGLAPSKANLVDGKYDFTVELSMQYRNVAVGATPALSGTKLAFFNELRKRVGSTAYTASTTIPSASAAVPNAYATLPDVESYTTPATNAAKVTKYTRSANTCSPLVFKPSL